MPPLRGLRLSRADISGSVSTRCAESLTILRFHGGFIPCGSSFLIFTDYCRASIRLACLMRLHIIYIFTHDSIGLGEDGPTHQPVEHLTASRAMPNLTVIGPADANEAVEAWRVAIGADMVPRCWH